MAVHADLDTKSGLNLQRIMALFLVRSTQKHHLLGALTFSEYTLGVSMHPPYPSSSKTVYILLCAIQNSGYVDLAAVGLTIIVGSQ